MNYFIQFFQQRDRFQVFASAKLIRHPFAFVAAVVEIKHRRHRIYAQAIEMKFPKPIKRVGNQKISYLVTAVVENVGTPVRMFALARIEMLVKRGAVEARERESVLGKMRRHPVHDHADVFLVEIVDEITKIIGRAVASRRREVVTDLITPRRSVWMFFEWQKLDVSKTHLQNA